MAIVKITPAGESIHCQAGQQEKFQFNISNTVDKQIRYGIQVRADDQAAAWLTIDGDVERDLQASSDSTIEVNVAPPAGLLKEEDGQKSFNFKLRVYDVKNPESTAYSATVSVMVKPTASKPNPFPWRWIAIITVSLFVIVGLVTWFLTRAPEDLYRYYRFEVTKVRNISAPGSNMVQLAELNFYDENNRHLTSATISNPDGRNPSSEEPDKANDGDKLTKWLDFNITPLIYDFGSPVKVNGYQLTTANDYIWRDPVRWLLYGRNDDSAPWVLLDNKTSSDYPTPISRFTATSRINIPHADEND
jgi:hypothetical protein